MFNIHFLMLSNRFCKEFWYNITYSQFILIMKEFGG